MKTITTWKEFDTTQGQYNVEITSFGELLPAEITINEKVHTGGETLKHRQMRYVRVDTKIVREIEVE